MTSVPTFYCDATFERVKGVSGGRSVIGYIDSLGVISNTKTITVRDNNAAEIEAIKLLVKDRGKNLKVYTDSSAAKDYFASDKLLVVEHVPRDKNLANTLVRAQKEGAKNNRR